MNTDRNPAVTAAFIMEGMLETDFLAALDAWRNGPLSLVEAVMAYIPSIHAMIDNALFIRETPTTRMEYAVANPFGEWMMRALIERGELPDRGEVLGKLANLCARFVKPATQSRQEPSNGYPCGHALPRTCPSCSEPDPYTLIDRAVRAGLMPGDPWDVINARQAG